MNDEAEKLWLIDFLYFAACFRLFGSARVRGVASCSSLKWSNWLTAGGHCFCMCRFPYLLPQRLAAPERNNVPNCTHCSMNCKEFPFPASILIDAQAHCDTTWATWCVDVVFMAKAAAHTAYSFDDIKYVRRKITVAEISYDFSWGSVLRERTHFAHIHLYMVCYSHFCVTDEWQIVRHHRFWHQKRCRRDFVCGHSPAMQMMERNASRISYWCIRW